MNTILLVILILLLLGALPTWPHSANWGYAPSGGLGLVLLILVILWLRVGCKVQEAIIEPQGSSRKREGEFL